MSPLEKIKVCKALSDNAKTYHRGVLGEDIVIVTDESSAIGLAVKIEDVVSALPNKGILFRIMERGGQKIIIPTAAGKKLIDCLLWNQSGDIERNYPMHRYNPFIGLFVEQARNHAIRHYLPYYGTKVTNDETELVAKLLNNFVDSLRQKIKSRENKARMAKLKRASNKNCRSIFDYIKAIFDNHSRVLVLRFDLAVNKPSRYPDVKDSVTTFDMMNDWREALLDTLQYKIFAKGFLGYIWKLEYGLEKSYHYHFIVFLDGASYREDVSLCKMIGDCWCNDVTQGKGAFFNCNAKKHDYRELGIGMIHRADLEKIRILKEKVATYFVKVDYYIRLNIPEGRRTLGRGEMPPPKSNRGRPSKKQVETLATLVDHLCCQKRP